MTTVERGGEEAEAILDALFPKVGHAYRIGITGSTGAGKSSIVNQLTGCFRSMDQSVGVVAEDPTSPFSGGALLGDRVRMERAVGDDGVFVRSIASRGNETGFSPLASEIADILDAFGRDVILLETIGVGQLEHRIRFAADTIAVVLTPEAGDDVQSLKSGLMEVGDIFVVNKADRPDAGRFAEDVRSMIEIRFRQHDWTPTVVETVATIENGVRDLHEAIASHHDYLQQDGRLEAQRREGLRSRLRAVTSQKINGALWENPYIVGRFDAIFEELISGGCSLYAASARLAQSIKMGE